MTWFRMLAVAAWVAACVSAAQAHSYVARAEPADGSIASPPPGSIRMTFDHPIEARYAKVAVRCDGQVVSGASAPQADAGGMVLTVTLPSRRPGHYTVEWDVVGRDGHRTNGSFGFEARAN